MLKRTDIKQVLREVLLANADVQAIVGDNVFGAHLDDSDKATVLQNGPLVVFEFTAGNMVHSGVVATEVLELYGWSKLSQDEATRTYDAAKDVLQAGKLEHPGVPVCGTARQVESPLENFNAKDRSWFARGRWNVTMKEATP